MLSTAWCAKRWTRLNGDVRVFLITAEPISTASIMLKSSTKKSITVTFAVHEPTIQTLSTSGETSFEIKRQLLSLFKGLYFKALARLKNHLRLNTRSALKTAKLRVKLLRLAPSFLSMMTTGLE
jgi:hypothetical protein